MIRLFAIGRQCFLVLLTLLLVHPASAQDRITTLAEAVYKTLEDNPGVRIEKEAIIEREGVYQASMGQFDWQFFSSVTAEQQTRPVSEADQASARSAKESTNDQVTLLNTLGGSFDLVDTSASNEFRRETVVFSTGMTKLFETGIAFSPIVSITDYKSDTSPEPVSRSDVKFKVVIPMMQGLGRQIAGAEKLAAKSNLKATELFSYHEISEDVYLTITHFWNCLAAKQSFYLVHESFDRADALFENVNRMVTAGLLEPAFLNQAKAKLYNTKVDVSDGELSYYETRQRLALAMGNNSDELIHPPFPEGRFPQVADSASVSKLLPREFIETARANRLDYHAILTSIETEEILLKKAYNNEKPILDFTAQLGYAGISEKSNNARYLDSVVNRGTGINGYMGISLALPIYNNASKGQIVAQNASVRIARLTADATFNRITSEVLMVLENIKGLISQHGLASKSADRYKDAVAFEKRKYDAGESTLNALIDIEDRYIAARLSVIEIIRKYAVAITNLKFVTGSLMERTNNQLHFDPRSLMAEFGK